MKNVSNFFLLFIGLLSFECSFAAIKSDPITVERPEYNVSMLSGKIDYLYTLVNALIKALDGSNLKNLKALDIAKKTEYFYCQDTVCIPLKLGNNKLLDFSNFKIKATEPNENIYDRLILECSNGECKDITSDYLVDLVRVQSPRLIKAKEIKK